MRFTLRSLVLASAMLTAAALATQTASAETFHVPFKFSVNGKVLPAGRYIVQWDSGMHVVTLRSTDNKHLFGWITGPGTDASQGAALRFDTTSSGYALRDVRYHAQITSRLDKPSEASDDSAVHVIQGQ